MRYLALTLCVLAVVLVAAAVWLWQDRANIADLDWPIADTTVEPGDAVTVTWLGVTTLLFDDNETQVLIDGFFTRTNVLDMIFGELSTDIATVNYVMSEFRINRLAAIVPVHSHFDHAMDAGFVANRSSAVVLGSESTANIVRGAQLPVHQYQILADGESRQFGNFTITLIVSRHAPMAVGEKPWYPGAISEPLRQPARIGEWKEGLSYSVIISHPRGTTAVQGSAGFRPGMLADVKADVVMLGIDGLSGLGRSYAGRYWTQTVAMTGASRVYPIHYDDLTKPLGEIELFPTIADDAVSAASWINEFAESGDSPIDVRRLPFGKRVLLY